jgi:soluble lytic murein transglycosylase-like protein
LLSAIEIGVKQMTRQDKVSWVFEAIVQTLSTARIVRAMSSVATVLILVSVLVKAPSWITHAPMSIAGQRLESFVRQETAPEMIDQAAHQEVSQESLEAYPARPLNRSQVNLVSFIAKKYSVELNDAQEFVFQAFVAASEIRVDPLLVLAVMSIESNFDPDARSPVGAQGLMQVLTRVHKEKFIPFGGHKNAYDPVANIRVGTLILKQYIGMAGGSLEGALKYYVGAAFHATDGGYGYKVLSERERLIAAAAGKPIPVTPLRRPEIRVEANAVLDVAAPVLLDLKLRQDTVVAVEAKPPLDDVKANEI